MRFSVKEMEEIVGKHRAVRILRIWGILFFTETILNRVPVAFLGCYERIDRFFAKMFPNSCTRCYVVLEKS